MNPITGEGRLLLQPRGVLWRDLAVRLSGAPEDAFRGAVQGPFLLEVPEALEFGPAADAAIDGRLMILLRGISGVDVMIHDLAPRAVGAPVVIGRSEQVAQVVLDSQVVSKRHAELTTSKGVWRLCDLESANGTFCEGRRLPAGIPSRVDSGHLLRFTKWRGILLSPEHLFELSELASKHTTAAGGGLGGGIRREALRAALNPPKPPTPRVKRPRKPPASRLKIPKVGSPWDEVAEGFGALPAGQLPPGPYLVEIFGDLLKGVRGGDPAARVAQLKRADLSAGRVFSLAPANGETTLVGRTACDVELGNSETSRRHAKFQGGAVWKLLDLESANGTYVDGRRLPAGVSTRVESGQVLTFASVRFVLLDREQLEVLIQDDRGPTPEELRREKEIRQRLTTPAGGLPLRQLVAIVGEIPEEEFLKHCRAGFLLQVPVVVPDEIAPEFAEDAELEATLQLSRTRILALERSKQISQAKVFTVHPPEDGGVTAGRDAGCEIVLDEASVSKRHAQFRHTKRGWHLLDLDSHNGTFVEGETVPANVLVPLSAGASLSLASYCALWLTPPMVHKLLSSVATEREKD